MKRDYFENHEELGEYMMDKARDGIYSVAVLFYDDAVKLMRELMMYEGVSITSLEISPSKYGGYEKEYYISLTADMYLSVEPAYKDGKYLDAEADLVLIDGEACSTIITKSPKRNCHEIYIGTIEDYCDDCPNYEEILLKKILENAEIVKDEYGKVVNIKTDIKSLIDYLFE